MEDHERMAINQERVTTKLVRMIHPVPWGYINAWICTDFDTRKALGPGIQVLLIRVTFQFDVIVTPFQATRPPIVETGEPITVVAEALHADIEPPPLHQML